MDSFPFFSFFFLEKALTSPSFSLNEETEIDKQLEHKKKYVYVCCILRRIIH